MRYEPAEDSPDRQQIGDRNNMRGGDVSEQAVVEEVCDAAACESENEDRQNRCEVEGCWMRANAAIGASMRAASGSCVTARPLGSRPASLALCITMATS